MGDAIPHKGLKDITHTYIVIPMKTYYNILQRVAKTSNIVYPKSNDFEQIMDYWKQVNKTNNTKEVIMLYTYIMYTFQESSIPGTSPVCMDLHKFIKIKHKKFQEYMQPSQTPLISVIYGDFIEMIFLAQKHYNAFAKLANIYRHKKQSTIVNDLLLNPIDINSPNTMIIYDKTANSKYVFTLNDLINHIETALSNTSHYFCEPLPIRNPYNNIIFTKSTLYNIYYKLKSSSFLMPILYHYYFLCDFDLKMFALKYEEAIRDAYIDRLMYKSDEHTMMKHMRSMIKNLTRYANQLHQNIDKTECIKVLRPYFYLYIISQFHIQGLTIKWRAQKLLNRRIHELYYHNPKFGRVYSRTVHGKRKMVSDLDHPGFTMNVCKSDLLIESFCPHDLLNQYDDNDDDDDDQTQDDDTDIEMEEGEVL